MILENTPFCFQSKTLFNIYFFPEYEMWIDLKFYIYICKAATCILLCQLLNLSL